MQGNHPKRRKDKYNPYNIFENDNKYYIEFVDAQKGKICIEINKEIYAAFNQFELDDLHEMNIFDRHMEHSEVYEWTLENRDRRLKESAEDEALRKIAVEELHQAIAILPENQRRRLVYYYFGNLTYEQIAEIENCSFQAVAKSIKAAEEKLKKFLE